MEPRSRRTAIAACDAVIPARLPFTQRLQRRPTASWDPQPSRRPYRMIGRWMKLPPYKVAVTRTERRKRAYGFEAHGRMPLRKEQHGRPQGQQASNEQTNGTRRLPGELPTGRGRLTSRKCTGRARVRSNRQRPLGRRSINNVHTLTDESGPRPLRVPPVYPPNGFTDSRTLSSKCFSTFPHGTCLLSVSP